MLKGPIAVGTIRTSFVLFFRLLVQAGTLLLVARLLGAEQFGVFAGITALAFILGALSTFGTQWVLLEELSKKQEQRDHVLRYAIPGTLLFGGILLVFYLSLAYWMLQGLNISLEVLFLIGIAEILIQPLLALIASEHHALGSVARAQLLHIIPLAMRLLAAASIFILAFYNPLVIYAISYFLASILALAVGFITLPRYWPSWKVWRLPCLQECIRSSSYAVINITRSAPAELDKALAFKLLPLGAAGIYVVGARVVGAISLPVIAMLLAALPRLFREKMGEVNYLLSWMYSGALAYSLLLSLLLWFLAPMFDEIFGEQYYGAGDVIRLLCIAIPAVAIRLVAANVLMTLGSPWMRVGFEVVGIALLIALSISLTAWMGANGLPLAVIFAEWSMAVAGGVLTCYLIKSPPAK